MARPKRWLFVVGVCGVVCSVPIAPAAPLDIKRFSLEELAEIDVYSPTRRLEPVQGIPSAVYVLTSEDIRRSRVLKLPEVLRLIPGVQVGRVDASRWAVSVRGFNSRIAHELQVLIDGRSVFDPLFSGVFWETQDVVLEDIERIEVIRGPGGTLWGPNAVNGVINIITKHARETQGGLVVAGAGTDERAFGTARYGWSPGVGKYVRVYAKGFERDAGYSGNPAPRDDADMARAGFRWDGSVGSRDDIVVSGDVYDGSAGHLVNAALAQEIALKGGNLLARWVHHYSSTNSTRLQLSYDHSRQDAQLVGLDETRNTYDFEFQHTLEPFADHQWVWGVGHRRTRDALYTVPTGSVDPLSRSDASSYFYFQDTVALIPSRWHLTLGTKVENTDYSNAEWQPNVRLAWTPNAEETWWSAISRAVRVPSRLERDLIFGARIGEVFQPEDVLAYEIGHRQLLSANVWYDVAVFYNVYNNLRNFTPALQLANFIEGRTYGVEVATRWQATSRLRLDTAYTYLQMRLSIDPPSAGIASEADTIEDSSPAHQFVLRTAYEVARDWELDATLRFVDEIRVNRIPAYTTLDLGFGWHVRPGTELTLVGQNILDSHHPEQVFERPNGLETESERAVYAKVTWRF